MPPAARARKAAPSLDRRTALPVLPPRPIVPPLPARRADDPLLTCGEVAALYRVHAETVRRWVRKGIIAIERIGPMRPHIRIRRSEAEKYMVLVPGAKV